MTTMCKKQDKLKHRVVCEYFNKAIADGEFVPGKKLPSERELAKNLNVNVATIRRAFQELVANGIIVKKVGSGTFLKEKSQELMEQNDKTINIVTSVYDGPVHKEFTEIAFELSLNMGMIPKHIKLPLSNDISALKLVNPEQPMIVLSEEYFLNGPLARMLKNTFTKSVVVGARLDDSGVASVVGDDNYGIRLLYDYFVERGHRKIAVLCNNLHASTEKFQVAVWRSLVEPEVADSLLINAEVPVTAQPMDYAFSAVKKTLAKKDFTALICLNDELAIGAMAACRECGKKLPEDVSIVSIGNTALCKYLYPRLTSIDPDLRSHIIEAIKLVMKKKNQKNELDVLHVVKPLLIERDSVSSIKHK